MEIINSVLYPEIAHLSFAPKIWALPQSFTPFFIFSGRSICGLFFSPGSISVPSACTCKRTACCDATTGLRCVLTSYKPRVEAKISNQTFLVTYKKNVPHGRCEAKEKEKKKILTKNQGFGAVCLFAHSHAHPDSPFSWLSSRHPTTVLRTILHCHWLRIIYLMETLVSAIF